jgi:HlyD family secretion protein
MNAVLNWVKRHVVAVIVGLVVVGALAFFFVSRSNASQQTAYQTVKIERGNLVATVGATGTVRARQSAVLVWQTSGTVEDVMVKVGDRVSADEVLATLKKTSLPQSIILAEADLENAKRSLDDLLNSKTPAAQAWIAMRNAQDAYDKAKTYYDSLFEPYKYDKIAYKTLYTPFGVRRVPYLKTVKVDKADEETIADAEATLMLRQAQLEDAQRAYERVKDGPDAVEIAAAQARINAAQATLNMARIAAPFAGVITQAEPLPGDVVTVGQIAFRIDDLSHLFVDVEVSEVDINNVQVGQPVTLSFDAILGKEYHGQVVEVGQAGNVVGGSVNFTVTVELTDADEQVKPGMTAAVNIVVNELKDVVLVPNRAVRLVDGQRVVYVLRNGQPAKVEIRLGASSGEMSALASGDLAEGDLVILNPPTITQFGPGGRRGPFGGN